MPHPEKEPQVELSKEVDVLLAYLSHQLQEKHHIEQQRASLTNLIFVISTAILALIAQMKASIEALPLAILLIIFGILGAGVTRKLFERHKLAELIMETIWPKIGKMAPNADLKQDIEQRLINHHQKFHKSSHWTLFSFWILLQIFFAIVGLIMALINIF